MRLESMRNRDKWDLNMMTKGERVTGVVGRSRPRRRFEAMTWRVIFTLRAV